MIAADVDGADVATVGVRVGALKQTSSALVIQWWRDVGRSNFITTLLCHGLPNPQCNYVIVIVVVVVVVYY